MKLIELTDFYQKNYFKNQTMIIYEKNIYYILGKNGIGKTSILKFISGLYNIKKSKNQIFKFNKKFTISYIPDKNILPKDMYAFDLIKLYSSNNFNMDLKKIFNLENKLIKKMSNGTKQKVALIICLSQNKDLYILDEVDTYLDDSSKEILSKIIKYYKNYLNKTFLIATNNIKAYNTPGIIWDLN